MNANKTMVDSQTKWWFRTGGIATLVLGLSYIVITAVYSLGGALPKGAEALSRISPGIRRRGG